MARSSRQRAKERQAARRAARQASQQGSLPPGDDLEEEVDLKVGAPPGAVGRSDELVESLEESDADTDIEEAADRELELEAEEAGAFSDEPIDDVAPETATGPRGARGVEAGAAAEERSGLGKVWHFLQNVWAELQRVQWPDRKQVTTLTGVVLGFVLLAGGYLGLLDAIFSRIIDEII
jgi:preprotein translocase subunit SecE